MDVDWAGSGCCGVLYNLDTTDRVRVGNPHMGVRLFFYNLHKRQKSIHKSRNRQRPRFTVGQAHPTKRRSPSALMKSRTTRSRNTQHSKQDSSSSSSSRMDGAILVAGFTTILPGMLPRARVAPSPVESRRLYGVQVESIDHHPPVFP